MAAINTDSVFYGSSKAEVTIQFGMRALMKAFTEEGLGALALAEVSLYYDATQWEVAEVETDNFAPDRSAVYVSLVRK